MKPCPEPGCPELVVRGRCPLHQAEAERRYRGRGDRAVYHTRRWRILSRRVLAEEPLCRACQVELSSDVDHIEPVEDGGPMWARSNLQALCHACHSRKTRQDVATRTFT